MINASEFKAPVNELLDLTNLQKIKPFAILVQHNVESDLFASAGTRLAKLKNFYREVYHGTEN